MKVSLLLLSTSIYLLTLSTSSFLGPKTFGILGIHSVSGHAKHNNTVMGIAMGLILEKKTKISYGILQNLVSS